MALRPVRLALVVLFLAVLSAAGAQTSPSEILASPEKYDGREVTLTGTVTNLRETISRKGNPYYTFDLSDGRTTMRIFAFGKASCGVGSTVSIRRDKGRLDVTALPGT